MALCFLVTTILFLCIRTIAASGYSVDPCVSAFRGCDFRFQSTNPIPLISVDGPFDVAVSPRIISKRRGEYIGHVNYTLGVLNANNIPAEVITRRGSFPITALSASPPITPTHIKPYSIPYTTGSGVGYQTLSASQKKALRHLCIRVYFTEYQILNPDGTVGDNKNNVPRSANKCVVFRFC